MKIILNREDTRRISTNLSFNREIYLLVKELIKNDTEYYNIKHFFETLMEKELKRKKIIN